MSEHRLSTLLVHAGVRHVEGAVVPPIFQSANYLQRPVESYGAVTYLRLSNSPQQRALADKLAAVEGAEAALALSSGMAAISTAFLSVLSAGDHVLVQRNTYGGTRTLLDDLARLGIDFTEIDAAAPDTWAAATTSRTRLFWVEGISNPLMEVPELEAVVAFGRARGIVTGIDNTFLSPVGFRPIPFGFDLVAHSATKYLNGHSDLVAGALAGSRARIDACLHTSHHLGGSLDPHAAFLLDRGMKTLALRVPHQARSAMRLAETLAQHPAVVRVRYPGLPTDPGHARAARWFEHFGAMLAFEVRDTPTAERFLERVRIPIHAASLGGVESLVVQPARSSHLGLDPAERLRLGITERLIRVSVGVEDIDDLLADFAAALG